MPSSDADGDDNTTYKVLVNDEEQYALWPEHRPNPAGWRQVGSPGPKAACLAYVDEVWTDMRPLSLRKRMEELARNPPPPEPAAPEEPPAEKLVDRLCREDHPVEVSLRPENTLRRLEEALERQYVHVKFTGTRGGTELGVRLGEACDLSRADFERGTGTMHLEGGLTLDYVKVRCVADIELPTLRGRGRLVREEPQG